VAKITRQALYRTPKPRMAPQRQPADKGYFDGLSIHPYNESR
jgi:hypothetical protein